jgi:hypothetical protein
MPCGSVQHSTIGPPWPPSLPFGRVRKGGVCVKGESRLPSERLAHLRPLSEQGHDRVGRQAFVLGIASMRAAPSMAQMTSAPQS